MLQSKSAIVMGATGAVGTQLLPELLSAFGNVTVLTRRPTIDYEGPNRDKMKVVQVDFEQPVDPNALRGHEYLRVARLVLFLNTFQW